MSVESVRYRLRPFEMRDAPALYAIHRAAMGDYVVQQWGPWDEALQRQFFEERIALSLMQVIEVTGGIAGIYEWEKMPDALNVVNIEVSPWLQGRGIGTAILRDAQRIAAERGVPVTLQVLKFNPAKRLYERLGFVETGESESHVQMTWRPPTGEA
jgi:ribosomal protein S18 acetylase RimI-like enzyme